MKLSGTILRVTVSLLIMTLLIILFTTNIFGSLHQYQKVTVKEYFIKGHLWISIAVMLAGALILYFAKVRAATRFMLMSSVFMLIVFVPQLFPVKCIYQSPYPLCLILKPVLFLREGVTNYPVKFTVTLFVVLFFSVSGSRLFCGWACPVGVLQDAIHFIPVSVKKYRLSFFWMNTVRTLLIAGLVPLVMFTGINIFYSYLNPFGPLKWNWNMDAFFIAGFIVLMLTAAASLFVYRPYCYMICPVGWVTWLLERVSLFGVRFNPSACTDCRECITQTSCPAVEAIISRKAWRPDCFSCGRCIAECPAGALRFGIAAKGANKPGQ